MKYKKGDKVRILECGASKYRMDDPKAYKGIYTDKIGAIGVVEGTRPNKSRPLIVNIPDKDWHGCCFDYHEVEKL